MNLCTWLTLLFVALKLTGFLVWSWWWVLAPTWVPAVVFVVGAVAVSAVMAIGSLAVHFDRWIRR